MKPGIHKLIKELSPIEKRIYNSIMKAFPATSHEIAIDYAKDKGVNFQFLPK